jgi:hypothetical protein
MFDHRPATVLKHLLDAYPAPFTIDELMREVTGAADDLAECEEVAASVRRLLAAGLLQRNGELLLPTRAAVHFDHVSEE